MIRRYLLDTGIAQDLQDDRNAVRERADQEQRLGHRIGICVPVLGELWAGVEGSSSSSRNRTRLKHALARLMIWPYSVDAAVQYGRLITELRRIGRPMQQVDIQIAAIACTLPNCIIVSKDSDMFAIPGVVVENWVA
jgi:tRNA(fMet)-specific endonuclease VapC